MIKGNLPWGYFAGSFTHLHCLRRPYVVPGEGKMYALISEPYCHECLEPVPAMVMLSAKLDKEILCDDNGDYVEYYLK